MKVVDISNLPKTMQRRPEIRALTLRVYPISDRVFQVPGSDRIHEVTIVDSNTYCTCQAARSGAVCAHSHAVKRYVKESKGFNV